VKSRWLIHVQVALLAVCFGLLAKVSLDLKGRVHPQDFVQVELISSGLPTLGGEISRDCLRFNRYITEAVFALRETGQRPPFTTAPLKAAIRRGECLPEQDGAAVIVGWLQKAYDEAGLSLPEWSQVYVSPD
jgi:hypothetical protein